MILGEVLWDVEEGLATFLCGSTYSHNLQLCSCYVKAAIDDMDLSSNLLQ